MASNGVIPPDAILNPYTPLAFLPPDVANQYQARCYVYVATLAAYSWDWLMSIPEEYRAVRQVGFSPPNIAYFVSRFGTLGSCVACTIFKVGSIDNCAALKYVEGIFFEISVPATSLLFFFRVKAVYNNSKIITLFFGILWLAIAGLSILIMLGITGDRIPYTRRCREGLAHNFTTVPIMLTAVNDTLIFFAISYRMVSISMAGSTWRAQANSFFRGDGLHHLSKSLLQSGQVYYFATIGAAIASTALILSPRVPGELHPLLGTAYFALASAMACRVFRAVLLGIIKGPEARADLAEISSVIRSTTGFQHDGDDVTTPRRDKSWSPKLKTKVEVEMNTRSASHDEYTFWDRNLKGDEGVSRLV
ncbi:hypothetical protein PILCRDRAFT_814216 [Piloderma croceum F 1598]|uniref:DUF6533 domain-containing protein n=1 Tax=Piloderma croceum (strain F 1598) TaxID=765440 RepID=A0A0C3CEZ9_PILCF|nr:hypothetical protein PILCRDRAFT_814216 [Piloderma croceum F 1598]